VESGEWSLRVTVGVWFTRHAAYRRMSQLAMERIVSSNSLSATHTHRYDMLWKMGPSEDGYQHTLSGQITHNQPKRALLGHRYQIASCLSMSVERPVLDKHA